MGLEKYPGRLLRSQGKVALTRMQKKFPQSGPRRALVVK